MDSSDIRILLGLGENLRTEFKSDIRTSLSDDELAEFVVCMANAEGGLILIGVEDSGAVTGLSKRRTGESNTAIQAMLFNKTDPPQTTGVERVQVDGETLIVIEVHKSARGIVATTAGKCLRRVLGAVGPECRPFPPSQHTQRLSDLGLLDYSSHGIDPTGMMDVDPIAMALLRQRLRTSSRDLAELPDEEALKALQLVNWRDTSSFCLNVAGLLCVGQEASLRRHLPTHGVAFQSLDDDGAVTTNEFLYGPLLVVLSQIEDRFAARNAEVEVAVGLQRVSIPDYPYESFREGLLNAVVHRDYARHGAVHVQLHSDRLVITNPGGFPGGVTLDNLLVHPPNPRNPRLADVLMRLGFVERVGRGIDRIFESQVRYGRPAPDYTASNAETVSLRLPGGDPSLQFVKLVVEEESRSLRFTLAELLALNGLYQSKRLHLAEIQKALQINAASTRATMERLVERGLVRRSSPRSAYTLTASVYRRLGAAAEYVRGSDFERYQQAAMAERYVREHGRITRREVIGLCQIDVGQAKRLLASLVSEGKLVLVSNRRYSHYIAPDAAKEP